MPATQDFLQLTDIDRRKCTRVVPLELICPGLPRTGTDSLKQALEIIGYGHVYHGFEANFQNALDQSMWIEALKAKFLMEGDAYTRKDWDQLLGHCRAVSDIPSICFAPELIAAYPEAKVILTIRDPGVWLRSIDRTLFRIQSDPTRQFINRFEWHLRLASKGTALALDCFFGDKIWTRAAERRYVEHQTMIKGLVPPERLLIFDVASGWEPLCEFLDVPIPPTPFPNGNATPEFWQRTAVLLKTRDKVAFRNMGLSFLTLAGAVMLGAKWWFTRRR